MPVNSCDYYLSKRFEWSIDNATQNSASHPHTWKKNLMHENFQFPDGLLMKSKAILKIVKYIIRSTEYSQNRLEKVVLNIKE